MLEITRLPKGQTEPVKEKFEDVTEFGFPGNLFLYIKSNGALENKEMGAFVSPTRWIPIEEVVEINGSESMVFQRQEEHDQFKKNVLGIEEEKPATNSKKN